MGRIYDELGNVIGELYPTGDGCGCMVAGVIFASTFACCICAQNQRITEALNPVMHFFVNLLLLPIELIAWVVERFP